MKRIIIVFTIFIFSASMASYSQETPSSLPVPKRSVKSSMNDLDLGRRYLKLANTYRETENFKGAKYYLLKAYKFINKSGNRYWKAALLESIGYYYKDRGKCEKACSYFSMSKIIYDEIIDQYFGSDYAIEAALKACNCEFPSEPLDFDKEDLSLSMKESVSYKTNLMDKLPTDDIFDFLMMKEMGFFDSQDIEEGIVKYYLMKKIIEGEK